MRSKVLVQVGTAEYGAVVVPHMLLDVKKPTTSLPLLLPRMASIMPWMYIAGIGDTLAQYREAATGATALKRFSPPLAHSSCTTICAPELWPVANTRLVST